MPDDRLPDERELRQWRKYCQQSRQALPVDAAWALGLTALLAAVHYQVGGLHIALWGFILFFGWFGFVGDLLNFLYLSRQIARAEQGRARKA